MSAVIKSPDNDDGQLTKEKPDEEAETKSKQPLCTTIRRYAVLTCTHKGYSASCLSSLQNNFNSAIY